MYIHFVANRKSSKPIHGELVEDSRMLKLFDVKTHFHLIKDFEINMFNIFTRFNDTTDIIAYHNINVSTMFVGHL